MYFTIVMLQKYSIFVKQHFFFLKILLKYAE